MDTILIKPKIIFNSTVPPYIDRIISNHPWLQDINPPRQFQPIPIPGDTAYCRALDTAETPETPELAAPLSASAGFSYRQAVGELIWAMVTCRPDISFPVIKVSQFAANPGEQHYEAVREIFRYLQATRDYGLTYWRTSANTHLPYVAQPLPLSQPADQLLLPPCPDDPFAIHGYADSDWAADIRRRRSVSGIAFFLAGAIIAYKTCIQPAASTSSTEAEFVAASDAGKMALYL